MINEHTHIHTPTIYIIIATNEIMETATLAATATLASSNTSASENETTMATEGITILSARISQVAIATVVGTILLLAVCGCAVWCCVCIWRNVKYGRARRGHQAKDEEFYAL